MSFPAILYPIVLFIGYFAIDMVQTDVSDNDPRLKTTDYLNSDLPEANTDSVLGGRLDNAEREYGQINDLSGVVNVKTTVILSIRKKTISRNTVSKKPSESASSNSRHRWKKSASSVACSSVFVKVVVHVEHQVTTSLFPVSDSEIENMRIVDDSSIKAD